MQSRPGHGGQDSGAVQEQKLRNPYLVEVRKPTLIEYGLCQLTVQGSLQPLCSQQCMRYRYYHPTFQMRKLRLKDVTWSKSKQLVSGWAPALSCPQCWEGKGLVNIGAFPFCEVQRAPRLSVQLFRGLRLPLSSELHDPGQTPVRAWVLIEESWSLSVGGTLRFWCKTDSGRTF